MLKKFKAKNFTAKPTRNLCKDFWKKMTTLFLAKNNMKVI